MCEFRVNHSFFSLFTTQITKGRVWPLINCLCLFTAVVSAFLDNVTTLLLIGPVSFRLCEVMQLNPVPILMTMIIFSNIGEYLQTKTKTEINLWTISTNGEKVALLLRLVIPQILLSHRIQLLLQM